MSDTPIYDDGSQVEIQIEAAPPLDRSTYVDSHDVITEALTDPREVEASTFLAAAIDPDDDDDNGEQWGTAENPTMTAADFDALRDLR